jgi:O-antigen ligase
MIRHAATLVTALLILLLVWAPLPFGGVTLWAETSFEILAFVALALTMAAIERGADLRTVAMPAAMISAVALYGFLQTLTWGEGIVGFLAPGVLRLERQAGAVVESAGSCRLSLSPQASAASALSWASAAAVLIAASIAGRRRVRRRWLGGAVLLTAIVEVFFGARSSNAGERTLWGVEVTISSARLRGTFYNPNHLALYLEIALSIAFAWGWWVIHRANREPAFDRRLISIVPPALVWLTLFAGLVFTQSRAGLIAALFGIVTQAALLAGLRRRLVPLLAGLGLAGVGIGGAIALGLQAGPARMLAASPLDVGFGARRQAWDVALRLWHLAPLTGTGLGSLRDVFPVAQPTDLGAAWFHAHNDPLEILATTGLVGAFLVAVGVAFLAGRLATVVRRGRRSEDQAAGLAALGAVAAVALHECFDFGLTIPANALTLAVVVGAAAAARLSTARAGDPSPAQAPASLLPGPQRHLQRFRTPEDGSRA